MLTSIVLIMVVMVYENRKIQFSNYMNPTIITIKNAVLPVFKEQGSRIGVVSPFPPRRFDNASIHTTKVLATLGPNILTVYSGCRMARWVYPIRPHSNVAYNWKHDDCNAVNPDKMLQKISQLSENDTIYVLHTRLRHFVEQLKLEELLVDIVVVSGQWALVAPNEQEDIDYVVAHPRVICWFIQNLDVYGGNNYNNLRLKRHPKVNPFPYGTQERPYMKQMPEQLFMEQYKKAFMMALNRDAEDGNISATAVPRIYAGHLRSMDSRKGMDMNVTKKLGRVQFYAVLSQHDYILSPNGDRPECYRHYEALGLGTVPLTQLDYNVHRHFIGTGLIFNNTVWSVQKLETKLSMNPTVNRNAALEEYWMEYVDWVVQRHLTWYDTLKQEPTTIIRILANLTF